MERTTKKVVVETLRTKLLKCSGVEVIAAASDIIVRSDSTNIASAVWVTKVALVAETFGLTFYISKSIVNGVFEAHIYEF